MKTSLLTAAVLAGLLALSGCAAASSDSAATPTESSTAPAAPAASNAAVPSGSSDAASSSPAADAAGQPSTQGTASTEGKVHFTGDYTQTTAADSARILELSKQWHSPEKEAALKAKLADSGLSSNIPAEIAGEWYSRAATACQARFDGHAMTVEGAWVKIDNLVRETYCPELG